MSLTLRTSLLPLHSPTLTQSRKSQIDHFSCFSTSNNKPNKGSRISGAELGGASDLAAEVLQRINTQMEEREDAMKRSKLLLFSELCEYLNLEAGDTKNKWVEMNPDEKLGLVKRFVSDWGLRFHPLSARSVRDLIDEFVIDDTEERERSVTGDNLDGIASDSVVFLPRLMNFFLD